MSKKITGFLLKIAESIELQEEFSSNMQSVALKFNLSNDDLKLIKELNFGSNTVPGPGSIA